MKWRTPQPGDVRRVRRFAWLPVHIRRTGETYWLRRYTSREVRHLVRLYEPHALSLRWIVEEREP